MVDVWCLQEHQLVFPHIQGFAVLEALQAPAETPPPEIHLDAKPASEQGRLRGRFKEAVHASTLVGFEMEQDNVSQSGGVEDLGDGVPDGVVVTVSSGMNQRRTFVCDQELVERDAGFGTPLRDSVDSPGDEIDSGAHLQI